MKLLERRWERPLCRQDEKSETEMVGHVKTQEESFTYLLIHLIPLDGYSGEVSDTILYPGNQGKCNSRSLTSEILSPLRNQMKWSMCLARWGQQAKLASQLLIP
ncbi:hypothetical protein H5410_046342 [Solanum commersonii]|uniref:Uncharacterized protein n=1 Tax=Solanum commersonii TaxID=4109 RepID=A0A9J5XF94_SOLCO|nr:hypothetical protein H5410_046342 [Solanum commersonii]